MAVASDLADLVLALKNPTLAESDGERRASAVATLTYVPPAGTGERPVESKKPFRFTAPLGPIEREEIDWYLERYYRWPATVFRERADKVVQSLPEWGRRIYDVLLHDLAREPFGKWRYAAGDAVQRFTVLVDDAVVEGSPEERVREARESATLLLSLPWELAHDGRGYLFQGRRAVRVRRGLPNRKATEAMVTSAPVRVLLLSPRPEDEKAGFFDHRVSARSLVEAVDSLGAAARLTILDPPTLKALNAELRRADQDGKPYHVVHFDGHGVYHREHGLGGLCFEEAKDAKKIEKRRTHLVMADELSAILRGYRVPLIFLEACQTAKTENDPTASVAARLLDGGVASVVAMSHSVLVETARRFVAVFYRQLVGGRGVGEAMLAGQQTLKDDTFRLKAFTGDFHLEDWFVPVLFQEDDDPPLVDEVPSDEDVREGAERRRLALEALPEEPAHTFVGRSRELLAAERLLVHKPYVVLRGEGGEGKTTLASELARWLVATRRFKRAAFVGLDKHPDDRAVLLEIGSQLVPDFVSQAAQDADAAKRKLVDALHERRTVLVLDNVESVLPDGEGAGEEAVLGRIFGHCRDWGRVKTARLVFTSREPLPEPYGANVLGIGRLDRPDAIAVVGKVLGDEQLLPHAQDEGGSEEEVAKLVDAVGCHARSLVLVAREVAASGVRNATERLHEVMAALHDRYPDDRERSLYASVELSLGRLPSGMRERIRRLAVFQGGGHGWVIAQVLGLDYENDEEVAVAQALVRVGLGEAMAYNHLRLHPALGAALARELSDEALGETSNVWAGAMASLTSFLYQQKDKDPKLAATLTLLELPNLLAALEHIRKSPAAEDVVDVATSIEGLLQNLGRPKAMARVVEVREEASGKLGAWSHALYLSESAAVDRLSDGDRFAEAVRAAGRVLQRSVAAGEGAYEGASYDLAMVHVKLGRALQRGGAAEAALAPLGEARARFQKLDEAGDANAAKMAMNSLTETGDCLTNLGRLDEAAKAYETSIELAEKLDDPRQGAVARGQLGTVRMLQRRYEDALAVYTEAQGIFKGLGESGSVAALWHQIGTVYRAAGQHESAEHAYQRSLKFEIQRGNRSGEAITLRELGLLYSSIGKREEAVRFHRQALEIDVDLGDLVNEGKERSNITITLIELSRYDEARQEILRAIDCLKALGHAGQLWKCFGVLCDLERALGDDAAAVRARERAVQAFLAYRRAGGENHDSSGQLASAVGQAIVAGQTEDVAAQLAELQKSPDLPPSFPPFLSALKAVLAGSRDPALASDPGLHYSEAVELTLLLEALASAEG